MFFKKKKKDSSTNQQKKYNYRDILNLVCWLEIPATDVKRAVKFYKKVFKCDFNYQVFNEIGYAFFKSEHLKGTIVQVDEIPQGAGPILFFNVEGFMPSVLQAIPENGGEIIKEKEMVKNAENDATNTIQTNAIDGNIGYFARFKDSEGNVFGLYSNS